MVKVRTGHTTHRVRHELAKDAHRALRSIARRYPASEEVRLEVARALAAISALDQENATLRQIGKRTKEGREVITPQRDLFG